LLQHLDVPPGELVFHAGDTERVIMCVTAGQVTLCTAPSGQGGLRLAAIGPGMVFGEMAFLNGIPRTAFAQAGPEGAQLVALDWHNFHAWAGNHREAALHFMSQLARIGIRRLGSTTMELRTAME
jgi:SulP family sulfate permease